MTPGVLIRRKFAVRFLLVNKVKQTSLSMQCAKSASFCLFVCSLCVHQTSSPSSLPPDAFCQEHQLMARDEAWFLPRPRGLSGLLKVKPFSSCHTLSIPGLID